MNQTLPTADLNTAGTTDVIPSVAIDRIIAQRNEGIALFMQAMECLATTHRILLDASGDIFLYGFEDCVTDSVRRMDKPEEAKRNITRLADRKIWGRLMTDTGMYTFMSSCQRDEWKEQTMSEKKNRSGSEKRQNKVIIAARVPPEEAEFIREKARLHGLTVSTLIRKSVLEKQINARVDEDVLKELMRLGRLQKHLFVEGKRTDDKEYADVLVAITEAANKLRKDLMGR